MSLPASVNIKEEQWYSNCFFYWLRSCQTYRYIHSSATSIIPPALTVLRCWCWCLATLCTRARKEGIVMLRIDLGISCIGISSEISWSPSKVSIFISFENPFVKSEGPKTVYDLCCMYGLGKENEAKKGSTWLESGHRIETSHLQGLYWSVVFHSQEKANIEK